MKRQSRMAIVVALLLLLIAVSANAVQRLVLFEMHTATW